jgi:zinc/manganese transport system substrate-binding protein
MFDPRSITLVPAVLAVLAVLILLPSCGGDSAPPEAGDGRPAIIVTTSIWADVVSSVTCGEARVETLIPIGSDPHGFEPSLADRKRLEEAVLVVANGLGLEEGLDDTISAVAEGGTPVFLMGQHIDPGPLDGDDPHVWFDPRRVGNALPALADYLVDRAGLDENVVGGCLDRYQADLAATDAEIAGTVAALPADRRKLVTSHDSLGYFANRYGFEIIGTVIPAPSTLAETNPAQLEELAEVIDETGVQAIFAETQHTLDDVNALAARVGDVEVVTLYTGTLGPPGEGADTYIGFLRTNAVLITESLG